jgi:hypothetical protein
MSHSFGLLDYLSNLLGSQSSGVKSNDPYDEDTSCTRNDYSIIILVAVKKSQKTQIPLNISSIYKLSERYVFETMS